MMPKFMYNIFFMSSASIKSHSCLTKYGRKSYEFEFDSGIRHWTTPVKTATRFVMLHFANILFGTDMFNV